MGKTHCEALYTDVQSERARTPVVPNRSDVLKQNYLQSFKTRRLLFDTDVKIRTATDGGGSMQQ
ncbi:hypothetical protein DWQ65_11230 [Treponema phagedenis]|uniref:Uncharacterized protein n=1 Tax=Treponema phagedenis TaxID=162 RepID=A0AAE6M795_TREPH|nr:hypothetical protein FUT79_12985 [Treponema phagedenis]QEJ97274.1 hypothetical protein FUT82_04245 [Treponema phagedenis]QSH94899.1 hypothetical protein C5O78_07565 [Treponema phagedenis]QSI00619.1 hypothetical protein DWQ65_11230 [Treponema phagedenis]TYT78334.1 hypothetical protein FS559_03985 [Treponema phagedenis]